MHARLTVEAQSDGMTISSPSRALGVLAGTVILAACGGSSSNSEPAPFDAANSNPAAAVCIGTPNPRAPQGGADLGSAYLNDGDGWRTTWGSVFGANQASIAETEAVSILCATVTESTEGERCDFEQDGDAFTLVMMAATYDIELRLASTANVIGRDTVSAAAEPCPIVTSWSEGDTERRSWPEPTADLARTLDAFFPDR